MLCLPVQRGQNVLLDKIKAGAGRQGYAQQRVVLRYAVFARCAVLVTRGRDWAVSTPINYSQHGSSLEFIHEVENMSPALLCLGYKPTAQMRGYEVARYGAELDAAVSGNCQP